MKTTACPALVVNIDCASPKLTRSDSTYKSGNSVQTNGATSRFGQYATETMYWAAISMAMPALLGMLLGVVVLIVGLIRRDKSRSAS